LFFIGLAALGPALLAPALCAHDVLSFDPNAKPEFAMSPSEAMNAPPAPVDIQGMASVRLRPDDLEIDLTVADGAAYRLLDHDPYQPPATTSVISAPEPTADESSGLPIVHDPHFDADKQLLSRRAESLFTITSNGAKLALLDAAVDLTESHDVVFHLTYPRAAPGPLRLEMTYFNQVPAGQKDVVTVLDAAEKTIASTNTSADTPYLDVVVPQAATAAPPVAALAPAAGGKSLPSLILGIGAGVAAMFLVLKFLRRPARG
jgi:hypothetical protein